MEKYINTWALAYFESLISFMVLFAYLTGYLFWNQERRYNGKKDEVLIWHAGIWSNLLFLSPVLAWIIHRFVKQWSPDEMIFSFLFAVIFGRFMLQQWAKGSLNLNEPFALNGHLTIAGMVHGVYVISALTVIFLYFFGTDPVKARSSSVYITLALMAHIVIGVFVPDLKTWGYLRKGSVTSVIVGAIFFMGSCLWLIVRANNH